MILSIELTDFGKFHKYRLDFSQGFNYIYGANEAGKSTIFHFILAMFYGFSKDSLYRKVYNDSWQTYKPLEGRDYRGAMDLIYKEEVYRIERSFLKEGDFCRIWNKTRNKSLDNDGKLFQYSRIPQPGALFFNLDQESFTQYFALDNLLSFTSQEALEEELYKAQNFALSKSSLDPLKALEILEKKKKEIGRKQNKSSLIGKCQEEISLYQEKTKESLITKIDLHKHRQKLQELDEEKASLMIEIGASKEKHRSENPLLQQRIYEDLAGLKRIKLDLLALEKALEENEESMEAYERAYPWLEERKSKSYRRHFAIFILAMGLCLVALLVSFFGSHRNLFLGASLFLLLSFMGFFYTYRVREKDKLVERDYNQLFHQQDQKLLEKERLFQEYKGIEREAHTGDLPSLNRSIQLKESSLVSNQKLEGEKIHQLEEKRRSLERQMAQTSLILDQLEEKRQEEEDYQRRIKRKESEMDSLEKEQKAAEIAQDLLVSLIQEKGVNHREAFFQRANSLFQYLSQGHYKDLFKEEKGFSLYNMDKNLRMDEKNLSRSSRELLLLSLRLAMLDSMSSYGLPLLMDDAFVHFDKDRKAQSLELLQGINRQILYFSKDRPIGDYMGKILKI